MRDSWEDKTEFINSAFEDIIKPFPRRDVLLNSEGYEEVGDNLNCLHPKPKGKGADLDLMRLINYYLYHGIKSLV